MLSPEQIEVRLERILLKVQKPGRYVGGEFNAVVKDWSQVETKLALIFPDIYDIGVSNVGLKILYDQINQRPDALAERAYAPWIDMEEALLARNVPPVSRVRHPGLFPALRIALYQCTEHPRSGRHPTALHRTRRESPAGHCGRSCLLQSGADARLY